MPDSRRRRYVGAWGLPAQDADLISQSRETADYFEEAVAAYGGEAKAVANWLLGEISRLMNANRTEFSALRLTPGRLAGLLRLIDGGTISDTGARAEEIVPAKGLVQISDGGELE
ncbi:MAG: Asp-tRNA(Asn)/Glu-tRNA(Gln) amidotransferase GatCAB subunit B, partial [Bacteroidota bacterium]